MSKLSHMKAVTRKRRNGVKNPIRKYTNNEMKELMPNFRFNELGKFNSVFTRTLSIGEGENVQVFIKLDKNGQICDSTRIGDVFSRIYGRSPLTIDWVAYMYTELEKCS